MSNKAMHDTIMAWAHKYVNIANNSKDGKTIYTCNKLFNHFYMMARNFDDGWIAYKQQHQFA